MRLNLFILFILFYSSCKQETLKINVFNTRDFTIVDTTIQASTFLQFDDSISDYPIYYIGPKVDTINIAKQYWRGQTKWVDDFEAPLSRRYSKKTLKIFVDTSAKTNSPLEYFTDNPKASQDSTINYSSFIFSISNISDSAIYLGRTFFAFFIHREAKDKNGRWVKVDKKLSELNICGTDEPTITLNPNNVLISKVKRYKGVFVTDFRLAFGYDSNIVYSNTFRDSIGERML